MTSVPVFAVIASESNSEYSKTFAFTNEGHTLGNVLTSIINRYPDVSFCGYTVPHPAESKMLLRIQSNGKVPAIDILRRGLEDIDKICDHTIELFEKEFNEK